MNGSSNSNVSSIHPLHSEFKSPPMARSTSQAYPAQSSPLVNHNYIPSQTYRHPPPFPLLKHFFSPPSPSLSNQTSMSFDPSPFSLNNSSSSSILSPGVPAPPPPTSTSTSFPSLSSGNLYSNHPYSPISLALELSPPFQHSVPATFDLMKSTPCTSSVFIAKDRLFQHCTAISTSSTSFPSSNTSASSYSQHQQLPLPLHDPAPSPAFPHATTIPTSLSHTLEPAIGSSPPNPYSYPSLSLRCNSSHEQAFNSCNKRPVSSTSFPSLSRPNSPSMPIASNPTTCYYLPAAHPLGSTNESCYYPHHCLQAQQQEQQQQQQQGQRYPQQHVSTFGSSYSLPLHGVWESAKLNQLPVCATSNPHLSLPPSGHSSQEYFQKPTTNFQSKVPIIATTSGAPTTTISSPSSLLMPLTVPFSRSATSHRTSVTHSIPLSHTLSISATSSSFSDSIKPPFSYPENSSSHRFPDFFPELHPPNTLNTPYVPFVPSHPYLSNLNSSYPHPYLPPPPPQPPPVATTITAKGADEPPSPPPPPQAVGYLSPYISATLSSMHTSFPSFKNIPFPPFNDPKATVVRSPIRSSKPRYAMGLNPSMAHFHTASDESSPMYLLSSPSLPTSTHLPPLVLLPVPTSNTYTAPHLGLHSESGLHAHPVPLDSSTSPSVVPSTPHSTSATRFPPYLPSTTVVSSFAEPVSHASHIHPLPLRASPADLYFPSSYFVHPKRGYSPMPSNTFQVKSPTLPPQTSSHTSSDQSNAIQSQQPVAKRRKKNGGISVHSNPNFIPPSNPMAVKRLRSPQPFQFSATQPPFLIDSDTTRGSEKLIPPSCDDKDGHYIVQPRDVIADSYTVVRQLGQGTFGKVAECQDIRLGHRVAIKIIRAIQKYRDASLGEIRVLKALKKADPKGKYQCVQLLNEFTFRNHKCMVFPLFGPSLFDFLRDNQFQPFPLDHVSQLAYQILDAVAFLHRLRIIHTDLKPENILLVSSDFVVTSPPTTKHIHVSHRVTNSKEFTTQKHLKSLEIRVIDFGSATFEKEYHSTIVSTRHYRAPEIILEQGWSFECDLWSIGCILIELVIGEALFQTHENMEHLAMMEVILGPFPKHMRANSKWFKEACGKLKYPGQDTKRDSKQFVKSLKPLRSLFEPLRTHSLFPSFYTLLLGLLDYNVQQRTSALDALQSSFFHPSLSPLHAGHPAGYQKKYGQRHAAVSSAIAAAVEGVSVVEGRSPIKAVRRAIKGTKRNSLHA